jgi:transposase
MVVAMEVGTHSPWISRLVAALGHTVLVANARKLRVIFDTDTKNDRVDAQTLARVARLDPTLLSPVHHKEQANQEALAKIRARDALVRARVLLINHARGSLKSLGVRMPRSSTEAFHNLELPPERADHLQPLIGVVGAITGAVHAYDKEIARLGKEEHPQTQLVQQVAGVGPLTALAFVATLEDPSRFPSNRLAGSFLGLRPRQNQSSGRDPQLRITKAGDHNVRRLLVHSAHYILGPFGPDTDLRRWGLALAARGGKNAKKRAVVAVARKLSVLLLSLWRSGQPYQPLRADKPGTTSGGPTESDKAVPSSRARRHPPAARSTNVGTKTTSPPRDAPAHRQTESL